MISIISIYSLLVETVTWRRTCVPGWWEHRAVLRAAAPAVTAAAHAAAADRINYCLLTSPSCCCCCCCYNANHGHRRRVFRHHSGGEVTSAFSPSPSLLFSIFSSISFPLLPYLSFHLLHPATRSECGNAVSFPNHSVFLLAWGSKNTLALLCFCVGCSAIVDDVGDHSMPEHAVLRSPGELCWAPLLPRRVQTTQMRHYSLCKWQNCMVLKRTKNCSAVWLTKRFRYVLRLKPSTFCPLHAAFAFLQ